MMIAQSYTLSTFLHHDLNTVERDQCKLPNHLHVEDDILGPVVQSVVSLTSSLRVISLTVLADSIHNILIFFAEKM